MADGNGKERGDRGFNLSLLGSEVQAESFVEPDPLMVGLKAANLMRMTAAGLPIPPGFVLGTEVCRAYQADAGATIDDIRTLVTRGIAHIESATGLEFGGKDRPLLVSVRSGAPVSMPGMLDTVLDIGIVDGTVPGLIRATGDPGFVWDSYRRLVQGYADTVAHLAVGPFAGALATACDARGVPDVTELDVDALRELTATFHRIYRDAAGTEFPQDPMDQLCNAVVAVLRSWDSPRAVEFRKIEHLSEELGTAVTTQAMVFGNLGVNSGSGVGFTRDPSTGEDVAYLDFALDAQGEDVVSGSGGVLASDAQIDAVPGLRSQLVRICSALEQQFTDAQDFEFTVEEGTVWLLQTRDAKRTPWAALQIACDLADEGIITPAGALDRLEGFDLDSISRVVLADGHEVDPLAKAIGASTGVASGPVVFDVAAAVRSAQSGTSPVLVRSQASTEDIEGMASCAALLTAAGARTCHAAVVARHLGIVCAVGCDSLTIDPNSQTATLGGKPLMEGDIVTIDGDAGAIYAGELELVEERPTELLRRVRALRQVARADPDADTEP